MQNKQDLVDVITTCTRARWFGGAYLQVGDELPRQTRLPRWFAEAYLRRCSPGFEVRIVEVTQ